MSEKGKVSRRKFIGASAAAAAATAIVPRHVLGGKGYTPPSEKLNIAGIGVAGQGRADINKFSLENIVALADVDWDFAAGTFRAYPEAKRYKDFRKMLDAEKNLDAAPPAAIVLAGRPRPVYSASGQPVQAARIRG